MNSLRKKPVTPVSTGIERRAHCTASSEVRSNNPSLLAAYEACTRPVPVADEKQPVEYPIPVHGKVCSRITVPPTRSWFLPR
ncbi:hypothetical protein [Rhodococcus phenolicus]|uniref:hypothetical protein n=1 Tax=Rhodococcus phenolicus TaxID=263849 RepID=UPI00083045E6|nr:hypothetical protein [Rhodococcus phenolicus]